MAERRAPTPSRADRALLVVAATLGTCPLAVLGGACIARYAPLPEDYRFLLGFLGIIPAWLTAMLWTFTARSGKRALAVCGLLSVALIAALFAEP